MYWHFRGPREKEQGEFSMGYWLFSLLGFANPSPKKSDDFML
jgi:hypothetical protein